MTMIHPKPLACGWIRCRPKVYASRSHATAQLKPVVGGSQSPSPRGQNLNVASAAPQWGLPESGGTPNPEFPNLPVHHSGLRRRNWVSVKVSSQKSRREKFLRHLKFFWAWRPNSARVSIGLLIREDSDECLRLDELTVERDGHVLADEECHR